MCPVLTVDILINMEKFEFLINFSKHKKEEEKSKRQFIVIYLLVTTHTDSVAEQLSVYVPLNISPISHLVMTHPTHTIEL